MAAVFNPDLSQPFAQWEEVEVTFSATAAGDTIVPHNLKPTNPEHVKYIPIRVARGSAGVVFHDHGATRKPWQPTYIILRHPVANAMVRLLLYVSHANQPPPAF